MPANVLCFDLDGTLLDENDAIHPMDRAVLLAPPHGTLLVPASGRTLDGIRGMFHRHGLFLDRPLPLAVVAQNGAACYGPGERLEYYQAFPAPVQSRLLALAPAHPEVTFLASGQERMFILNPSDFGLASAERYSFVIQPDREEAHGLPLCKMMCLSENPEPLEQIRVQTGDLAVERAYSMPAILEFTPQGANKGSGLRNLLAALRLEHALVYAAGDGGNDLPLLEQADRAFAPSGSPAAVLARVDRIIDRRERGLLTPILEEIQ